jgi:hypothetical protein
MIWGAMSAFGRAGLWFMPPNSTINGTAYLQILQEKLPTFMSVHGTHYFQQDGAPCHGAGIVMDWLRISGIKVLGPWPGNSPDLNVIENVWHLLKRKVAEKNPTSAEDLKKKTIQVWTTEITPEYCKNPRSFHAETNHGRVTESRFAHNVLVFVSHRLNSNFAVSNQYVGLHTVCVHTICVVFFWFALLK